MSKAEAKLRERTYKKKGRLPAGPDDGALDADRVPESAMVHLVDARTGTVLATGRLEATASGVKGAAASTSLSGSAAGTSTASATGLTLSHALAGSSAGTSTVTADLTVTVLRFIPDRLPAVSQQTFAEAKALAVALADGRKLRRWKPVEGELALWHQADKARFQTKITGGPLLDLLGLPHTADNLRKELQHAGLPAVLLLHVVIAGALERAERNSLYVTVKTDDLITAIGWKPRSTVERETMRQRVWRWLAMFDAARVIGRRVGTYRDQDTKKEVLDLASIAALIKVMGQRKPAQFAFDDSAPPVEVTYAAGPWIEQWRGDHRILTYFGDVRHLASIPAGKPSGAWAQAIGLALNQQWRERSSYAQVKHVGEDKALTVDFGTFTRRDLLDLFPPEPGLDDVLSGEHPQRAREYWQDAIGILKRDVIISYYKEHDTVPGSRKGWQRAWLNQPLDIRPSEEGKQAAAEIATRSQVSRRARAKRKASRNQEALRLA